VQRDGVGDAGQFAVHRGAVSLVEHQRHKRRRRRHDGVAEASCKLEAGAVAAGLRQRFAAGGEHDAPALDCAARGHDRESILGAGWIWM
jgi:hypothetical protein